MKSWETLLSFKIIEKRWVNRAPLRLEPVMEWLYDARTVLRPEANNHSATH